MPEDDAPNPATTPTELLRDRRKMRVWAYLVGFLMTVQYAPCYVIWWWVKLKADADADPTDPAAAPATASGSGTDWLCSPAFWTLAWVGFVLATTAGNQVSRFSRNVSMTACGLAVLVYGSTAIENIAASEPLTVLYCTGMVAVAVSAMVLLWKMGGLEKIEARLTSATTVEAIATETAAEAEEADEQVAPGWDETAAPEADPLAIDADRAVPAQPSPTAAASDPAATHDRAAPPAPPEPPTPPPHPHKPQHPNRPW